MNGIENARHYLFEAASSLETAIELLASIDRDAESDGTLKELVSRLSALKEELDATSSCLPTDCEPDDSPESRV